MSTKKRTGIVLLYLAAAALIVGSAVRLWPTEAPRHEMLEFSVQCTDNTELSEVHVTTPNDDGPAEQKMRDPHNTHYGSFTYAVTHVGTQYSLQVACVRRDTDPSVRYEKIVTTQSTLAAWGTKQNFGCETVQKGCTPTASGDVTIGVSCEGSATVTDVFVVPRINQAGSATLLSNTPFVKYRYRLATPDTPYYIEVTCTPTWDTAWTAKSNTNSAAIGSTHFSCKPAANGSKKGECSKR